MPTDKRTHKMHKKNKQHKKCGAKVGNGPACRHTAKDTGRCQAHSALALPIKKKKEAEKKLKNQQKRQQEIAQAKKAKEALKPKPETAHE